MNVFKEIPRDLDLFEGDLLITVVGEDERPLRACNSWIDWRLYGTITQLLSKQVFRGVFGEKCLLPTYGRFRFDRIVLIGGGLMQDWLVEGEQWSKLVVEMRSTIDSLRAQRLGLCFPRIAVSDQEKTLLKTVQDCHLPLHTTVFLSRAA